MAAIAKVFLLPVRATPPTTATPPRKLFELPALPVARGVIGVAKPLRWGPGALMGKGKAHGVGLCYSVKNGGAEGHAEDPMYKKQAEIVINKLCEITKLRSPVDKEAETLKVTLLPLVTGFKEAQVDAKLSDAQGLIGWAYDVIELTYAGYPGPTRETPPMDKDGFVGVCHKFPFRKSEDKLISAVMFAMTMANNAVWGAEYDWKYLPSKQAKFSGSYQMLWWLSIYIWGSADKDGDAGRSDAGEA